METVKTLMLIRRWSKWIPFKNEVFHTIDVKGKEVICVHGGSHSSNAKKLYEMQHGRVNAERVS